MEIKKEEKKNNNEQKNEYATLCWQIVVMNNIL